MVIACGRRILELSFVWGRLFVRLALSVSFFVGVAQFLIDVRLLLGSAWWVV